MIFVSKVRVQSPMVFHAGYAVIISGAYGDTLRFLCGSPVILFLFVTLHCLSSYVWTDSTRPLKVHRSPTLGLGAPLAKASSLTSAASSTHARFSRSCNGSSAVDDDSFILLLYAREEETGSSNGDGRLRPTLPQSSVMCGLHVFASAIIFPRH